jgi:hypothetical protein
MRTRSCSLYNCIVSNSYVQRQGQNYNHNTAYCSNGLSYAVLLYSIESEILKNTQRDIFHIFTSEDIDHVTFSNLLLSVKFHNFLLGTI